MEWGARALGNRSILADPSRHDSVREINKRIKSRDFWMHLQPRFSRMQRPSTCMLFRPYIRHT